MAERALTELRVSAPGGDYPILLGRGALDELPALLKERGVTGRVVVVTNATIAPLYGERVAAALSGAALIVVPDGERYKTLDTVRGIYADFLRAGLDRSGVVVALGGGVVGDMAGFAAATYMRGVRLIQAPTSLLAMVDASIGGKVGVDLPEGKNLVGAFKQPVMVVTDPDVLTTLPAVEFRAGMAEVIKAGLIGDAALVDMLELGAWHAMPPQADQLDALQEIVARAIAVKVAVVEADPFEGARRAVLNLGHTFAHALEVRSGYTWRHGEAVAVGMVAAARLSAVLGLCDAALVARVEALLAKWGLPTRAPGFDPRALWEAMATDKKWRDGQARFVLMRGVGETMVMDGVPREPVVEVVQTVVEAT